MNVTDKYLHASFRENTTKSYKSAIEHFEVQWKGFLPATADSIEQYLAHYAEKLSLSTLRQRLSALAKWHKSQGFPDPTKTERIKAILKGIAELHPVQAKQARPLQIEQLEVLVSWLEEQLSQAMAANDRTKILKHSRDKALVLVGFWRAFRSDELCRLQIESIHVTPGVGMEILLSRSKGDRNNQGRRYKAPALKRLCPVTAYSDWIYNAHLTEGPVFRAINHAGGISDKALHVDSIPKILRRLFHAANIPAPDSYSGHSLRHGFATWANDHQWDIKGLMEYVGWKDVKSAMRYIDAPDPFARERIERGLDIPPNNTPTLPVSIRTELEVNLIIERFHKGVKSMKKVRESIEHYCLGPLSMQVLNDQGSRYRIYVAHETSAQLDEIVDDLIDQIHNITNNHECMIELSIQDPKTQRAWD